MSTDAPNSLLLHQYHLGELEPDERDRVRAALESDPDTLRRYQAIQAAESSFSLQSLPPWAQDKAAPRRRWWRYMLPVLVPTMAIAAAAATALVVVSTETAPGPALDGGLVDTVRIKGELPALEVWVGGEAGARPLRDGESLSEGSHVQLVFDAHGGRFATLAGRDGTGEIEVYGTVEVAGQSGLVEAPFGLVLDDAPGPQTFFVLTHEAPLADDRVMDHVRDGTGDLTQIVLDKD